MVCSLPAAGCRDGEGTARWLGVVLPLFLLSDHMAAVVAIAVDLEFPHMHVAHVAIL
jgi:hypothetical protein